MRFVLAELLTDPIAEEAILFATSPRMPNHHSFGRSIQAITEGAMLGTQVDVIARRRLRAAISLNRLIQGEKLAGQRMIDSPSACFPLLVACIGHVTREHFLVLFLSVRKQLIAYETLFQGDVASAAVYPRVVAERALAHQACSVIVAHNHPSGALEPSRADIDVTHRLRKALATLDIELDDHVVVAGARCFSLRQAGYL